MRAAALIGVEPEQPGPLRATPDSEPQGSSRVAEIEQLARQSATDGESPVTLPDPDEAPAVTRAHQINLAVRAAALGTERAASESTQNAQIAHVSPPDFLKGDGGTGPSNPAPSVQNHGDTETGSHHPGRIEENALRLVRGLQTMINHRGGAMHMRLDPPELGSLRVQMQVVRGVVSATFEVESTTARQLLTQHLGMLRHSLEHHGLQVERLHVHASAQSLMQNESNSNQHPARSDEHRRDAGQHESRGRREYPSRRENPRPQNALDRFSLK